MADIDALVETVSAPPRLYEADPFLLEALLFSQSAGEGVVTVSRDGRKLADQAVTLRSGHNRVETAIPEGAAGRSLGSSVARQPGQ